MPPKIRRGMKAPTYTRNAFFSALQVVVSAIVLFFLYRFLVRKLGIDQLGIWSVVLSAASANRIGEIGLSGGMVKYVSKYLSLKDEQAVSEIIQTAIITIVVVVGIFLLVTYPVFKVLLGLFLPQNQINAAVGILPIAMISLWFNSTAAIFISSLEGCQRYDSRSFLIISGNFLLLSSALYCVPIMGLMGVAVAYLVQAIFNQIAAWWLLKAELHFLPVFPYYWQRRRFFEMIGYGANIQIAVIVGMLYEPTTKLFLSRFGGLSMTGYYEMAVRMISQCRSLLVSSIQVIVPVIADLKERSPELVHQSFSTTYHRIILLSIPYYMALVLMLPAISEIWIGQIEPSFIIFGILLSIGWLINTLNTPAYFISMGVGRLRWNTISHMVIGILNLALNYLLGTVYGGHGVVVGWSISLAIGSMIISVGYMVDNDLPLVELFPSGLRVYSVVCIVATIVFFAFSIQTRPENGTLIFCTLSVAALIGIASIIFWHHPERTKIISAITRQI